ncbi:MAG: methyltransferase [Ruminococcaceae bacterium]|nr:methyltransferase [Oscillospiraceae bacterium]
MERLIRAAGFEAVSVKEKPVSREYEEKWGRNLAVGEYIMSSTITARKPLEK